MWSFMHAPGGPRAVQPSLKEQRLPLPKSCVETYRQACGSGLPWTPAKRPTSAASNARPQGTDGTGALDASRPGSRQSTRSGSNIDPRRPGSSQSTRSASLLQSPIHQGLSPTHQPQSPTFSESFPASPAWSSRSSAVSRPGSTPTAATRPMMFPDSPFRRLTNDKATENLPKEFARAVARMSPKSSPDDPRSLRNTRSQSRLLSSPSTPTEGRGAAGGAMRRMNSGGVIRQSSDSALFMKGFSPSSSSGPIGRRDWHAKHASALADKAMTSAGGIRAAHEADRRYQQELKDAWKRETRQQFSAVTDNRAARVFDFLCTPPEGLTPGARNFLSTVMGGCVTEEWFETGFGSNSMGCVEIPKAYERLLRETLTMYATVSQPGGKPNPDMVYRPTFCRFLLDAGLVAYLPDEKSSRPSYHFAVSLFDAALRAGYNAASVYALRSITVEQCVNIVAQLLLLFDASSSQNMWVGFEASLVEAQNVLQSLIDDCKRRVLEKTSIVTTAEDENTIEYFMNFLLTPPASFTGTTREWSRGLRQWTDAFYQSKKVDAIAERSEQIFARDCYLRDALVEPACVHVCLRFSRLFRALFAAYRDDSLTRLTQSGEGSELGSVEELPHMSFAAFFRFCLDFQLFPMLGSFEELKEAYCCADSAQPLQEPAEALAARRPASKHEDDTMSLDVEDPGWLSSQAGVRKSQPIGSPNEIARRPSLSSLPPGSARPIVPTQTQSERRGKNSAHVPEPPSSQPLGKRTVSKGPAGSVAGSERQTPRPAARMSKVPAIDKQPLQPLIAGESPKVKAVADYTWMRASFPSMTVREQESYALLVALDDCVTDRFLRVRGLFKSVREVHPMVQGITDEDTDTADASETLEALSRLRIVHSFKTADMMRSFIQIVSKGTGDVLDLADLEKAVEMVHADRFRRKALGERCHPISGIVPFGSNTMDSSQDLASEAESGLDDTEHEEPPRHLNWCEPRGGGFPLGQEARLGRFELIRCDLSDGSSTEVRAAFGPAAFAETLLLLSLRHMHSSGKAEKVSAPDSAKAFWLICLLYYRFDELRRKMCRDKPLQSRSRGSQRKSVFEQEESPANIVEGDQSSDFSASSVNGASDVGSNLFDACNHIRGAKYTSFRDRLLEEQPDLFDKVFADEVLLCEGEDESGTQAESAGDRDLRVEEICEVCNHVRQKGTSGRPFCYSCSGVDDEVLCNSLIHAVFERSRLRYQLELRGFPRNARIRPVDVRNVSKTR